MSKLLKYYIIDPETGKWAANKTKDHHSIAVPKMLNSLELRIKTIIREVVKEIEKGVLSSVQYRKNHANNIHRRLYISQEEIKLDFLTFGQFEKNVLENIGQEPRLSPMANLKKMDSPLRQRKTAVHHVYERLDNDEILDRLISFREFLEKSVEDLETAKAIWDSLLSIVDIIEPNQLIFEMVQINKMVYSISSWELRDSFFIIDDVTRGLLHKSFTVKVNMDEVLNKLIDMILRTMVKSIHDFRKSDESKMIEKAFSRLKELNLDNIEDFNIQVLISIKISLEVHPLSNPSLETCYKKIGELHSNMNSKILLLRSLNYLEKYFPESLSVLTSNFLKNMIKVRDQIVGNKREDFFDKEKNLENRSIAELQVHVNVIEDMIFEAQPGTDYFYIYNKLHSVNSLIASKYYHLDEDNMRRCLKILADSNFALLIKECEKIIHELREEVRNSKDVDPKDIEKVGVLTGKTKMIKSYGRALEEILAGLGTFIANTLHVLLREMLINIPGEEKKIRMGLEHSYRVSEISLRNLDEDSLSESYLIFD